MIGCPDYQQFSFSAGGKTRAVYWRGSRGATNAAAPDEPPVLLLHELPGLSAACLQLADRIAAQGYTVYVPLLIGQLGDYRPTWHSIQAVFSSQWTTCCTDKTSPVVGWLRELTREIGRRHPGQKAGAIGMCLTGTFPLALLSESNIAAVVISQPALPFSPWGLRAPGLAAEDLQMAAERVKREKIPVLAWRFVSDPIGPGEKFFTLAAAFRDTTNHTWFVDRTITAGEMTAWGIPEKSHPVLTGAYDHTPGHPTRQRFDELTNYFNARLR